MNNESSQNNKSDSIKKSLIKWAVILGLIGIAVAKNLDFVSSAIKEIQKTTRAELIWCIFLANIFFVVEGNIHRLITKTGDKPVSIWKGIVCSYMCAFYRLATLGSGSGVAQVYYYNINGISASTGTGMALSQYTMQKISIGLFGIISYFTVISMGDERIEKYSKYMLLGTIVIAMICIFLLAITISKTISDFVVKLGRKIIKENSKLYSKLDKADESIKCLQEQGRKIWRNKLLFIELMLLNIAKFSCWYAIIGVLLTDDFDVELLTCILLMAICNMIGCVMVAPSGVGTLEFVFAIFFAAIIPNKKAIAATIVVYRFFTWIVPFVIGSIPAMLVKKKKV